MAIYVCSDIHGLWGKYQNVLDFIDLEKDQLYILGDVIDRGNDGFKILLDCLKRKNIVLLMGNHEYMMWETLQCQRDEIVTNIDVLNWILNGAVPTIAGYNKASQEDKELVYDSLKNLPYAITDLVVQNRHYYLCHSSPKTKNQKEVLYERDLEDPLHFVWDRMSPEGPFINGKTIISGHTIVLNFQEEMEVYTDTGNIETANYIDIDCGCAMNNDRSKLALLCLDDLRVRYF